MYESRESRELPIFYEYLIACEEHDDPFLSEEVEHTKIRQKGAVMDIEEFPLQEIEKVSKRKCSLCGSELKKFSKMGPFEKYKDDILRLLVTIADKTDNEETREVALNLFDTIAPFTSPSNVYTDGSSNVFVDEVIKYLRSRSTRSVDGYSDYLIEMRLANLIHENLEVLDSENLCIVFSKL